MRTHGNPRNEEGFRFGKLADVAEPDKASRKERDLDDPSKKLGSPSQFNPIPPNRGGRIDKRSARTTKPYEENEKEKRASLGEPPTPSV
ncbi:hypothetical protein MA16_Dca027510 [Dendrobium catenatum]|uniref:Uncharacterized protein n=1 Tax=Dendrobium catenatum TaxID=906689 RepID=A0A2I0W226_9ASPA|nr:hypothetical protein MA16_Dca027510 [Dendrobium catenatum]